MRRGRVGARRKEGGKEELDGVGVRDEGGVRDKLEVSDNSCRTRGGRVGRVRRGKEDVEVAY